MRDMDGNPLVPSYNVDRINVKAGLDAALNLGYDTLRNAMVIEYSLMRHGRGEEDGAERSALSGGIDLTSWRVILAHAITAEMEA